MPLALAVEKGLKSLQRVKKKTRMRTRTERVVLSVWPPAVIGLEWLEASRTMSMGRRMTTSNRKLGHEAVGTGSEDASG